MRCIGCEHRQALAATLVSRPDCNYDTFQVEPLSAHVLALEKDCRDIESKH